MDTTNVIALILFLIIWGAFIIIFIAQYCQSSSLTERLVQLNVRTALFLPLYSLMLFIATLKPTALAGLNIFITFTEGYSFYCFYTMIIYNLGGPKKAVEAFAKTERDLACCQSRLPSDPIAFYKRTIWALFHLLFTRTVLISAAALSTLAKNTRVAHALSALFTLISTVILFSALIHILLFYEKVYESSSNLFGIIKAILLKVSVGLIVLQGLIVQFMTVTGSEPYTDDSHWTMNDKTIRGYAVLVLIEYVFLSPLYLYAFGIYKISPPEQEVTNEASALTAPSNICSFLWGVLHVFDVWGYLAYPEGEAYTKVVNAELSQKVGTSTENSTKPLVNPPPGVDPDSNGSEPEHEPRNEPKLDRTLELRPVQSLVPPKED